MQQQELFETLYGQLKGEIFSYAFSIMRTRQESEEILQETFLALYRQLGKGFEVQFARAWLYRVAGNFCFSRLRRERSFKRFIGSLDPPAVPEPVESGPGSEELACRRQERQILDSLLSRLPVRQRAIIALYRDGFKYSEIASLTGTRKGTVGVVIRRSLERFEKAFAQKKERDHEVS